MIEVYVFVAVDQCGRGTFLTRQCVDWKFDIEFRSLEDAENFIKENIQFRQFLQKNFTEFVAIEKLFKIYKY